MTGKWQLVFLSTTDWDAPQFGSRQQLAKQFVNRSHQVLFVEVPRALHSAISDPAGTKRALRRMGRTRQIADGPLVYTPPPVLPVYYHPWTNTINQRLLGRALGRTVARLGWQVDVVWTYWPNTAALAGRLGERAFVYHCIDDFAAVSYPLSPAGAIADMEERQCRRADVVFARTSALAEARRRWNENVQWLPGGVDTEHFDPARVSGVPEAIARIPGPRMGFLGTLDNRIDVELLVACAEQHPEAHLVLVGPTKGHRVDLGPLRGRPNVHMLPACAHSEAPSVMAGFDVCLIPYRMNRYTHGLSPIKLYEYLAMEKRVVGTALPYLVREEAHITLAETQADFVSGVAKALASPPTAAERAAWRQVAMANSWSGQAATIERALAPFVAGTT